jgi:hypothetical protein
MQTLSWIPQPWWVNLLWLVPPVIFYAFRQRRLSLSVSQLGAAAVFAVAFGFMEAAVVVYLRAAVGLLPGFMGTLAEVQRSVASYDQSKSIASFPQSLLTVEVWREAATMVMLASLSWLAAARMRERCALFLWAFAIWDSAYYAGLWLTIRWPPSLRESDVLFLIPVPWIAQVWFPMLISGLSLNAILVNRRDPRSKLE